MKKLIRRDLNFSHFCKGTVGRRYLFQELPVRIFILFQEILPCFLIKGNLCIIQLFVFLGLVCE